MPTSKDQMQRWAVDRIRASFPPAEGMTVVDDLFRVAPFFEGESALLFGMATKPGAFADPAELVELSREGLRAWFDHFGATGQLEQQARLYGVVEGAAEPALVRQRREEAEERERARAAALAKLPRPIDAIAQVSKPLARALESARGKHGEDFFEAHGAKLGLEGEVCNFEWWSVDPGWEELVDGSFGPPFFPFAGADGDSLGVLVLEAPQPAPVVFFSHEEGFSFVADDLEQWRALCDAAAKPDQAGMKRAERGALNRRGRRPGKTAYDVAFKAARNALERLSKGQASRASS